jgi:hypothetical protein
MMRRMRCALLFALASCGPPYMDGLAWASPDRSTFVFRHRDDLIASYRGKQITLAHDRDCFASDPTRVYIAGHRVVMLDWHGNGHGFERGALYISMRCAIDLDTGARFVVPLVTTDVDDMGEWIVGARTDWTYRVRTRGNAHVIDPRTWRDEELPFAADGDCDAMEVGATAQIACAKVEGGQSTREHLLLVTLDTTAFPPKVATSRTLDVANMDQLKISPDGTQLAWVNHMPPHQPGGVTVADWATLSPRVHITLPETVTSSLDFSPAGDALVVGTDHDARTFGLPDGVLREVFPPGQHEQSVAGYHVYWLLEGRILIAGFQESWLVRPRSITAGRSSSRQQQ